MMEQDGMSELPFRADFSARVLQQVEGIRRSRRVRGSAVVAVAAVAIVSAVVLAGLRSAPPSQPISAAPPVTLAISDNASAALPSDPLALMFPDAEPLARFSDQYAEANVTPAEERNAFAFAADTDENESGNQDL
jgi:hypothetical protein